MGEIKKAWLGDEKLWKVFWIYNFLLGGFLNIGIDQIDKLGESFFWVFVVVYLVWAIWVLGSLWRCAFNASWKGWGYIIRGIVVLCVVVIVLAIFGFQA